MSAGKYNITIERGSTFDPVLTWKDSAGTPIDITGYAFRFFAKLRTSDASPAIKMTTEGAPDDLGTIIILSPATNGQFQLLLTDEQTSILKPSAYLYNLEYETPSGKKKRLLEGSLVVDTGVTA